MNREIDGTDEEILRILWQDGRISMQRLGQLVHLSGQAVKNRIEKLEALGIIQHYTVNINCPVYDCKIHALIKLELGLPQRLSFEEFIRRSPCRILHCYQITGRQSYIIDVFFRSDEERDNFLADVGKYGVYEIDLILRTIDRV